jgi:hypothetical protein
MNSKKDALGSGKKEEPDKGLILDLSDKGKWRSQKGSVFNGSWREIQKKLHSGAGKTE